MNMMNTRPSGFELETGGSNTKYIVLGGIALLFAVGAYFATSGKAKLQAAPHAAASGEAATLRAAAPAPSPQPAAAITPSSAALASTPAPIEQAIADATPPPPAGDEDAGTASGGRAAAPAPAEGVADPGTAETRDMAAVDAAPELTSMDAVTDAPAVRKEGPAKPRRKPPPPALLALQPWWNAASPADFAVQYVGQAAERPAIVIRLSKSIAAQNDADRHIHLLDPNGDRLDGGWQSGGNGFVLVRDGLEPGRYTVRIDPDLASAGGEKLAVALSGPVYVQ